MMNTIVGLHLHHLLGSDIAGGVLDFCAVHPSDFQYSSGMTMDQMTAKMKSLIDWMKTDEYWLAYGGYRPEPERGGDLIEMYQAATEDMNMRQSMTLLDPMRRQLETIRGRPQILNRTTTNRLTVFSLDGLDIELFVGVIRCVDDIIMAIPLDPDFKREHYLRLWDGDEEVDRLSRLICTDQTALLLTAEPYGDGSDFDTE